MAIVVGEEADTFCPRLQTVKIMKGILPAFLLTCGLFLPSAASGDCLPSPSTAHHVEIVECYSSTSPFDRSESAVAPKYFEQVENTAKHGGGTVVLGMRRIREASMDGHTVKEWRTPSEDGLLFLYVNPGKRTDCPVLLGATTEIEQRARCCDVSTEEEACLASMDYGAPIRDENGCWKGVTGAHCKRGKGKRRNR